MSNEQMHKEFVTAFNPPSTVLWDEESSSYVVVVATKPNGDIKMCVGDAFHVQQKWLVWEHACKTMKYSVAYNANPVRVLTDALAKVSNSLIAAGNVTPQAWHSDNEKRAFVVMKAMGEEGLEAIARSLME